MGTLSWQPCVVALQILGVTNELDQVVLLSWGIGVLTGLVLAGIAVGVLALRECDRFEHRRQSELL